MVMLVEKMVEPGGNFFWIGAGAQEYRGVGAVVIPFL
jgi:hypothetical protein